MSKRLRVLLAFFAATLMVSGSSGLMIGSAEATGGGNEDCPSGTTQLAKYNWQGGGYVEEGSGVVNVTGTAQSGTFTADSGYLVSHVIVKGSNTAKTVPFSPPVSSGSFNNVGLINNGGQTPDISNVKFCGSKVPDQPDSKVTYSEWADGDKSCESKTVTQTREKTVTPYKWNGSEWVPDAANAVTTTETQTRPMTEAELKGCAGDQPDSKVTYSEWVEGEPNCESKTVTKTRTKTVTPYKWNGSEWVLDTANATSTTETETRPLTEAELKECEGTPPPDSCPPLTGSVKTTLADGSVVNGNIYTNKSDVYISGDQLGDVTTVYIRVTDPSGSVVLSATKTVTVTDGSFGPVQLPAFNDSPNNGDEYKVWVSSTTDFEQKCTKFDNFKVKGGDEPPPPPPIVVTVPTQATLDPCNPEGVTNNVVWKDPLPVDSDQIDWTESNNGATRTAALKIEGSKWSDGTTAPKVFNLPADSGEKCVTTTPTPTPTPTETPTTPTETPTTPIDNPTPTTPTETPTPEIGTPTSTSVPTPTATPSIVPPDSGATGGVLPSGNGGATSFQELMSRIALLSGLALMGVAFWPRRRRVNV